MKDQTTPTLLPIEAKTLRAYVAISSAALIAFGAICWIAANWSGFHRFTKLELAAGLLVVTALAAALFPRAKAPALLVSVGAVGGLLALIGQFYPSGADAWLLFALWAGLALPFALAARHDSVWSLWTVVAGAGIGLWRLQEFPGRGLENWWPAACIAIGLAALLSPWTPLQRLIGRSVWAFRLAALGAVALIGWGGLEGMFRWSGGADNQALFAAIGFLAAIMGALALMRPLEVGVLALTALAFDGLLIGWIGSVMNPRGIDKAFVFALMAAGIVGASVAAVRALVRIARPAQPADAPAPAAQAPQENEEGFSWALAALSGFGALFAAVPFLFLLGLVFSDLVNSAGGSTLVGAGALGAAAAILRGSKAFGFRQMFGLIVLLAGLTLLTTAAGRTFHEYAGFPLCFLAVAVAFFVSAPGVRPTLGFFAASSLLVSMFATVGWKQAETSLALTSFVAAFGALALAAPVLGAQGAAAARLAQYRNFILGWTVACLCALILLAGRPFLLLGGGWLIGELSEFFRVAWKGPAQAVSLAMGVGGCALLLWRRADLRTPLGYAVAAAAVALCAASPTLGATIVVLAAAMLAPARALAVAAALASIWIVSALYYSLAWTLAQKGYGLMALGAVLGAFVIATRKPHPDAAPEARGFVAAGLIALGLLGTGALAGNSVWSSELLLANGREIFIALRPVDPRSLVQGDYMAIAFDTDRLGSPREVKGEALAYASLDARSIATIDALAAPGVAPAPGQIPVKLRRKGARWFVGSDAWFFEEGHAADYAFAKYGAFRVGADGRLLLTALTDGDLKKLK